MSETRTEHDALGELEIPSAAYYGIHSLRSARAFPFSGQRIHPALIHALADVKCACAQTNAALGYLDAAKLGAMEQACAEIAAGQWLDQFIVDPYQGGAGTSTNMNANEVVANRAIELLGGRPGDHSLVHPFHDVNMHQSTNDVYPTALAVAALRLLKDLEDRVSALQAAFQEKEGEFRGVVKAGRTEMMDAVPMTLGMSFGAYAEAFSRDRWRIFKCRERIKRVNLGGTVLGTGVGAPREYILKAASVLRRNTGLPVSRAENMVDATQNMDRFVEVFGMLKAYAVNLFKVCSDLRLMASGPAAGLGEISLPAVQTGSSIMAGKINPVVPEAVSQVALRVMGNDHVFSISAACGQLDLNHLMPLLAHTLLESLGLLGQATEALTGHCRGIAANSASCRSMADNCRGLATLLVPHLGYKAVEGLLREAEASGIGLREHLVSSGRVSEEQVEAMLSPANLCRIGFVPGENPLEGDGE
ncbi:aspartate ammonia-lyase [Salidesulfovibrio onnuriiensis]|uniref:aspartate ammonia-lyase n=1 Tax=Salidesulfovibrio onnuriiensis TaxID=2583823 RepID=UPI0011C8BAD5|nr:aspartate ammonia-lyase [Salidesulfovibrio onnuriiensis]